MAKLVSKVYGDALFQLALEKGTMDQLFEESDEVIDRILSDDELSRVLNHPAVSKEEKIQLMERIVKGRISGEMEGFLRVVLEKDRYGEAKSILDYFKTQVKEYKKIGVVYISTPMELNEVQKKQVENRILETSSYETLECHYQIQPELMGGMVIRIKDRVIDSSLKNQMERLSKELLHLQIGKKV